MNTHISVALAFFAALGSGLMAGVFFAFSVFVMRAPGRLPEKQGIEAMQGINAAVLQSCVLFGIFRDRCRIHHLRNHFASHLAGAAGIVAARRQPLLPSRRFLGDDAMQRFAQQCLGKRSESREGSRLWARYLSRWTAWNHVRTILSLAATAAFILVSC
jgi:uncharacterized membrane protein